MAGKAKQTRLDDVTMQGVQIRIRNFSGKEGQYNVKGQRNFLVLLDDDIAEAMGEDGWNIKYFDPRDDQEKPQAFLKVKVNYNGDPKPRITLVTSRSKTRLEEDDISLLDWADIINVDLIINPYSYEFNGKTGITAYLRSGFFTIQEDELDLKYADVPDSAQSSVVFRDLDLDEPDVF